MRKQKYFLNGTNGVEDLRPFYFASSVRALTLVEVMLSLGIIALGVLAGVELMARVLGSDNKQSSSSQWETRMMTARQEIGAKTDSQLATFIALGGNLRDVNVTVATANNNDPAINPYPASATALTLQIKDSTGGISASVPMLKIKDGQ